MNWSIFFAFLSPAILGFMNVLDTFIVKKRVKNVLSFVVVSGIMNLLIGLILVYLFDWGGFTFWNYRFSIIAGAILGIQLSSYYLILSKHDASHAIGLIYSYPIIVALLSYLFLGERLSLISYLGILIIIFGVISMHLKISSLRRNITIWSLVVVTICAALEEFFIKLATIQVEVWHGTVIGAIFMGFFVLPLLFIKGVRQGVKSEFRNIKFAFVSEALTILGIVTLYLGMIGLPATIVSALSVTQPLFVLFFEWIAFLLGIKIVIDKNWKTKLLSLGIIVLGLAILYWNELFYN